LIKELWKSPDIFGSTEKKKHRKAWANRDKEKEMESLSIITCNKFSDFLIISRMIFRVVGICIDMEQKYMKCAQHPFTIKFMN
jgi:hypothetical protein